MTSAALLDLQNRINTNTLTALQQSALSQALTVLIPLFPSVDDTSQSVPITEDVPLSREWIAALYTIQALFSGGGSGVLPTNQPNWFIDPVGGNDANNGLTAGTALQHASALAALWRGVSGGGRPILLPNVGTSVTIHVLNNLPTNDPLSVLLDVDLMGNTTLAFVGGATVAHTSTLTTASAFARTHAGGQITATDAATANFGPFVGTASLFTDTTSGAIAWLYGPDTGASATATLMIGHAPQTGGTISIPALVAIAGGDGYTLSTPITAALGQGFVTRNYPTPADSGALANVFFYRLSLIVPQVNDNVRFASPTANYIFQECQMNHAAIAIGANVTLVNCLNYHSLGYTAEAGGTIECYAGGISGQTSGTMTVLEGGSGIVDGDFLVFSGTGYTVGQAGLLEIGNAAYWNQSAPAFALSVTGGIASVALLFGATSIFYGTAGTSPVQVNGLGASFGQVLYRNDGGGTPAQSQFQFDNSTFTNSTTADMTFGVNAATAAYVGPTTATFPHLDAALAAGTGFGGRAQSNAVNTIMRIAA